MKEIVENHQKLVELTEKIKEMLERLDRRESSQKDQRQ
jgi:hypothetical protein